MSSPELGSPATVVASPVVPADAIPKTSVKFLSTKRKWALALWGTSLASAGAGFYFNDRGDRYQSDYNGLVTQWATPANRTAQLASDYTSNYNHVQDMKTYRNVSYGVSLTALIAGTVLWFLPEEK